MRILYVTHYGGLYGANHSLLNMIICLRERFGVEPVVLLNEMGDFSDKLEENDIPYIFQKYKNCVVTQNGNFIFLKKFIKKLLRYTYYRRIEKKIRNIDRFDFIHSNSSVTDLGYFLAEKWKIKHIWHIREYGEIDYGYLQIDSQKNIKNRYLKTDTVITISRSINEMIKEIDNGINTEIIYNGIKQQDRYEKEYFQDGMIHFCIVGLISYSKNQKEAIEAVNKLVKMQIKNICLHIVGDGRQDILDEIKEYIKQNHLEKYVKLEGYIRDVPQFLKGMDVGLMTSKKEAFGRVTIEYMNNYMPVIGSNTGGTKELMQDGINGYLYNAEESDLVIKMKKMIDDKEKIRIMGKSARVFSEKFTIESNAEKIYRLYEKV